MYSTDFEARKAIINKLGGDTVNLTNIFQCELVILALYGGDPSDVNNIFEADKKILTLLGGDVSGVTSVFDARKAIITQLGGDASLVNSLISASEMELEYASIKEDYPPYVTFTAEEAGSTIGLAKKFSSFTLEYSYDTRNWTPMSTATSIALANIGDKVYIRGKLTANLTSSKYTLFKMTGKIAASGSCNALWNYEDPEAQLRNHCGRYMFAGCASLTKAPELPATTLVSNCYASMFDGCTSLTQAPVLPATTLVSYCYNRMFLGCSSLTSIKCLATTNISSSNPYNWTYGVASSGVFYKFAGVEWPIGTAGIPSGWEVKTVGYTITFANWDGTILQTIGVTNGQIPVYNGPTPTRPFDDQYYYVFNGWSPAITEVTRDITYTALYTQIPMPAENYVTFIAEEAGSTIGLAKLGSVHSLKYSTDTQSWMALTTDTSIALSNIGDKIYVRGILSADPTTNGDYTLFKMTGKIAASGNCNALWNLLDLEAPLRLYCGRSMFNGCTSLTTAPELPATTLADLCYNFMFAGCTSLTQTPELPATTLAHLCYGLMFSGCTSLTQAPELPATTLVSYCYDLMFSGCTSLTQAPELPATTVTSGCYRLMFENCKSLTQAPELPATTLADYCYNNMFNYCRKLSAIKCLATDISASNALTNWTYGVASSGVFCKAPGVEWPTGTSGIPTKWTICEMENTNTLALAFQTDGTLNIAKVSSSADFKPNISMSVNSTSDWQTFGGTRSFDTFYNFTKGTVLYFKGNNPDGLNKANTDYIQFATTGTIAAFGSVMSLIDDGAGTTTTIPNERCFAELFRNTTIIRAPKLPATTLTRYCYLNMFRNCTSLTVAPHLPAKTLAPNCYQSMFNGCTQLTGVSLPATTLAAACYNQTFVGCSSLTSVILPATSLVDSCYYGMFLNCSKLSTIICNATDISTSSALTNWTDGVASTGTFRKADGVEWPTGASGIPSAWTVVEI